MVYNKENGELYGQCKRATPLSDIACFFHGCDYSVKTSQTLKTHLATHYNGPLSFKSELFDLGWTEVPSSRSSTSPTRGRSTIRSSNSISPPANRYALLQDATVSTSDDTEDSMDVDAAPASGSDNDLGDRLIIDPPSHGQPASLRPTRPRINTSRRLSPYPRSSPSSSRDNSVSRSRTPNLRVAPSPLGQLAFSAPASPISGSEAPGDGTIDDILRRSSLQVLQLNHLETQPTPSILLCTECQGAPTPDSVVNHISSHDIRLHKSDKALLRDFITASNFCDNSSQIVPPPGSPAIAGLKMQSGRLCRHCSYCCETLRAMSIHLANNHPGLIGSRSSHSSQQSCQSFFLQRPIWFAVNPQTIGLAANDLYRLYLEQIVPEFEKSTLLIPATTSNEIPPLLRVTRWHDHLEDWVTDKEKIIDLCNLVKVPTTKLGLQWAGKRLREVIVQYMLEIRRISDLGGLSVQMLLMEFPRVSQHGKYWQVLTSQSTIDHYALLLHQWSYAILQTLEDNGHISGYAFKLSDSLIASARKLKTMLQSGSSTGLIDMFHDFIKLVLLNRDLTSATGAYSKWDNPIECLFALSAVRESGSFKEPQHITQMFAQATYHIRGAILFEGNREFGRFDNNLYKSVEHFAAENLSPGALSPYNSTQDYQRLASALAFSTNNPPTTQVSDDGLTITYCGTRFSVPKWRSALETLMTDLEDTLDDILLQDDYGFQIPDLIADDWTNTDRQYSWMSGAKLVSDKRSLLHVMLQVPGQRLGVETADGKLQINSVQALLWLQKTALVVDKLALLLYMTAGQTPRVAEFIDHKIVNSTRPRTIFWHDGAIYPVTRRTKTDASQRRESFLPMKCHPRLTVCLAKYLSLVRPVEAELARFCAPTGMEATRIYQEFLFTKLGKRMVADDFYKLFKTFTNTSMDSEIGVQEYRQICVELGRVFLGSELEMDEEEFDVLAEQAGHSAHTARAIYAKVAGSLPGMTSDLLLRYARVSEQWWEVAGLKPDCPPMLPLKARQKLHFSTSNAPTIHAPVTTSAQPIPSLADFQSMFKNLSSHVSAEIQSVKATIRSEVRQAMAESLATMESLPKQHPVVPVPTRTDIPNPGDLQSLDNDDMESMYGDLAVYDKDEQMGSPPSTVIPNSSTLGTSSFQRFGSPTLKTLLHQHFPESDDPSFTSIHQERAVTLALARSENFVAVMPTGSGKSLVFTLPAFADLASGFRSYVIVPNRALLHDHVQRVKKLGLPCYHWSNSSKGSIPSNVVIVFLAMETAGSPSFQKHFHQQEGVAVRLIVDEAHQVLADRSFRADWNKIVKLAALPVQKIYLTASLPIRLERIFLETVGLPPSSTIIRAPSIQKMVAFYKIPFNPLTTTPVRFVIDIANYLTKEVLDPGQLGIIFCKSVLDVEALHSFTKCSSHSKLKDKDHYEMIWKNGDRQWIAATTGLIHGIDSPKVAATIFWGVPFGLINLYQGSGRGGRGGHPTYSITIYQDNMHAATEKVRPDDDLACEVEAEQWLFSNECRRLGFSRLFDGVDQTCVDVQGVCACDHCDQDLLTANLHKLVLDSSPPTTNNQEPTSMTISPEDEYSNANFSIDLSTVDFDSVTSFPQSSSTLGMSSFSTPQSAEPSIRVLKDQALHLNRITGKTQKVEVIDSVVSLLHGKCAVCWAWKGVICDRHQRTFLDCQPTANRQANLPWLNGWINLKKSAKLPQYKYCYFCGIPQDTFLPPSHPAIGSQKCPISDFVIQIIWLIGHSPTISTQAKSAFPTLPVDLDCKYWGPWVAKEEDVMGGFYNGLELVIWFIRHRDAIMTV